MTDEKVPEIHVEFNQDVKYASNLNENNLS